MAEAPAVPVALTPVGVGKSPLIPFPDNPSVGGWTKQVTCRYFIHGVCKEGNNCRYSHDLATSRSNAICRFYQRGCCRYGDKCSFIFFPAPSDQDIQGALSPELKANLKNRICPYAAVGQCRYGVNCYYSHGDPCDMCGLQVLHPTDMAQRSEHIKNCIDAHEKDMELSFAIQRSKDVVCGICMEVVYEKANLSERRFGILSNCKHSYCLTCIQRWRDAKHRENNFIKSCPECDIKSNFVIPSEYWVVEKDEKEKLIRKNNEAIRNESCYYFAKYRSNCPLGDGCFFKHVYPDGPLEDQRREETWQAQHRNPVWEFEESESRDDGQVLILLSEMLSVGLEVEDDDKDPKDE
uniref:RING-type E3 ubiquitin transferase n=1 Tax=Pyxicephalus adspersus TaxID=30357 RepID=A0AAV3B4A2_PYXAD|nr:TPA: hypothetical protein GDO54_006392 [Pyxicephalus adspersus]